MKTIFSNSHYDLTIYSTDKHCNLFSIEQFQSGVSNFKSVNGSFMIETGIGIDILEDCILPLHVQNWHKDYNPEILCGMVTSMIKQNLKNMKEHAKRNGYKFSIIDFASNMEDIYRKNQLGYSHYKQALTELGL